MRKEYTAKEMREYAAAMADDLIDSNHKPGELTYDAGMVIVECLRQAAGMRERCEEAIADVNGPNSRFDHGVATPDFDANEIVDYILHGDAGKEEK